MHSQVSQDYNVVTFTTLTSFNSNESARSEPSVPLDHDSLLNAETEKWNAGNIQVFTDSLNPNRSEHRYSIGKLDTKHATTMVIFTMLVIIQLNKCNISQLLKTQMADITTVHCTVTI